MNVIMTNEGNIIEVQGTGEEREFTRQELNQLLDLAEEGNKLLVKKQRDAIGYSAGEILKLDYGNEIVIATGNAHKVEEIGSILADFGYNINSLKDVNLGDIEIIEDGKTFEHNALIKARAIAKLLPNTIVIADDSGLEVDLLNKKPGIYSARFAGENATDQDNRTKLLDGLSEFKDKKKIARFVSSIAVVFPDSKEFVVRGTCEGRIIDAEIGENGFGYDPIFIPDGYDKTFGELPSQTKNEISHRANALKIMKEEFFKRVDR